LKKVLGLALFLVLVISGMSMVVSSGSLPSEQSFAHDACGFTATITSNGVQVKMDSDSPNCKVSAVFVPAGPGLCDSDSQSAYGFAGEIHCFVDGYYYYGESYYHTERHLVTYYLIPNTELRDIELTFLGDNVYEYTCHFIPQGFTYFYEDISMVCSTHFECSVWWLGIYIGSVYLTAVIYGP
jgi:hypothetical protein